VISGWLWPGSLRLRLLGATLVTLALALAGAYGWLGGLFRDHVMRQFDTALVQQLDQLTARLAFDELGTPQIDPQRLSDPRWSRPYSGLYWQLDRLSDDGQTRRGVLRSRSLWDAELRLDADALADGALHTHDSRGPQGEALRVVERSLAVAEQPQARWRLIVAADTREALVAVERFRGVLAASLAALGVLLALAALAQVAVGLAPLKTLQRSLQQVREGHAQRLEGRFPAEVQPLIDDFNGVLDRNAEVVARARTQAGNLAHALKTPLAVLENAARQTPTTELGPLVSEQVALANRHIHWHLARARAAAQQGSGERTPLALLATAAPMRVSDTLLAATRDDPAAAMDMINVWSHSPALAPFAVRPGNPAPGFNVVWQNLRLMQRIAAANATPIKPIAAAGIGSRIKPRMTAMNMAKYSHALIVKPVGAPAT